MRIFWIIPVLWLTACVSTEPTYKNVSGTQEAEIQATDVNFQITGLFHKAHPQCAAVLSPEKSDHPTYQKLADLALARYLGEKLDRVIFPRHRNEVARKNAYDLETLKDRKRFSRRTRCPFYAIAKLYDLGDDYVGFAAKKHVGISVELRRFKDDAVLWQAAHTVWRANGGVPMSPLSALGGIASASYFKNDQEILPSLIDDSMRRMMRTLPVVF